MALLSAGEVEFVLAARETLEDHALKYHEMLRYHIVLITSRNHPLASRETVTPNEAAKWPAVVPPTGSYSRQFGETAAREIGVDVKAVLEVGGWGVIKRYVERGIGICMEPSICLVTSMRGRRDDARHGGSPPASASMSCFMCTTRQGGAAPGGP